MTGSASHIAQFKERGLIRAEGLIAREDALRAQAAVRSLACEHGLLCGNRWTKSPSKFGHRQFGLPKPFRSALNSLIRSQGFPNLMSNAVLSLAAELVEAPVTPMPPGQQVLFTLPGEKDWAVPHNVWHLDLPRFGEQRSPGLQIFTFLADVEPQGGGTLVVSGSHHLLNRSGKLPSKTVNQVLSEEQFFRTLFDPARSKEATPEQLAGTAGEVELEVVELCGKVGDVYLMDLRMLHTPAPNAADDARMMLTCRLPRPAILDQFLQTPSAA